MFTNIVTHVEPGDAASVAGSLATALALAAPGPARLVALVFPAGAEGDAEGAGRAADAVREAAASRGVPCEVRMRGSYAAGVGEVLAAPLRLADLGVLVVADARDVGTRLLARAAIFTSGRPVVLAPLGQPMQAPPSRVAVAWDATPAAVRAVHGAMPLLRQAEEVAVVTVADDKDTPPDPSGEELARMLEHHGARARVTTAKRGRGGVHAALAGTAREMGAGLLVMGALLHAPLHDLVLGSATHDLLTEGPSLPTLVSA